MMADTRLATGLWNLSRLLSRGFHSVFFTKHHFLFERGQNHLARPRGSGHLTHFGRFFDVGALIAFEIDAEIYSSFGYWI